MEDLNIHIDSKEYLQIQQQLKKNKSDLFEVRIQSQLADKLQDWILKEYPILGNGADDILFNVSRRLKNQLRKFDFKRGSFNLDKYSLDFLKHECQISLPNEENRSKNLGLTKSEFNTMVDQLKEGNEALIEKVYLQQFKSCMANLIRAYSCTYEEAYECTIDALYEIRKDLIKNKIMYGNLASFFNRRAAFVLFKQKRKSKIETVSLDYDVEYGSIETDIEFETNELEGILNNAISKLGTECKHIIKQFYYDNIKLEEIATELNKKHATVRKQISRCRNILRSYIGQDLYCQFKSNNG